MKWKKKQESEGRRGQGMRNARVIWSPQEGYMDRVGRGLSPQEPREATPAGLCRWTEPLSLPQGFQRLEVRGQLRLSHLL